MKTSFVVVLALFAGRAYAEELVEPVGAADGEALHGDVLVWADATFYTDTSDSAQMVHAARLAGTRKDHLGDVIAMRVVSAGKDGFVEVEPAAQLDCTWARLETSDDLTRVRLFVKRADLAPVLTQPFEHAFEDGTRIALRPGVAVIATVDERFVVGVRGAAIVTALPAASIGHAYTPDHVKAAPTVLERDYELAPNTRITLGDQAIKLDGSHASQIERRGAATLFSIRTRCAALDVSVATKAVREIEDADEDGDDSSSGLSVLSLRDHDYIPAGTVLASTTGHAIAVAAKPMYLPGSPHGKTACVERRMIVGVVGGEALDADGEDGRLRVCAPAASVVHERLRSASSANGTTMR
ncbi:MAG TPA: hypothetical protein VGF94_23180 [Kofleriaceae bacterium]